MFHEHVSEENDEEDDAVHGCPSLTSSLFISMQGLNVFLMRNMLP